MQTLRNFRNSKLLCSKKLSLTIIYQLKDCVRSNFETKSMMQTVMKFYWFFLLKKAKFQNNFCFFKKIRIVFSSSCSSRLSIQQLHRNWNFAIQFQYPVTYGVRLLKALGQLNVNILLQKTINNRRANLIFLVILF